MNSHFTSVLHATSRAEMAAMVIFHFARNYYVEKVPEVLVCLSIHLFITKIGTKRRFVIIIYRHLECWETR